MAFELDSILASLAVLISVLSAYLSRRALDAQISISKNTAFFTQKAAAEEYLALHPELLELHGIEPQMLNELEITEHEFVYLMQSFNAAELYYQIAESKTITLSQYRKTLLSNPKVKIAWQKLIRGKLLTESTFTKAVDAYYDSQAPQAPSAATL
jgi:hypothetical protein